MIITIIAIVMKMVIPVVMVVDIVDLILAVISIPSITELCDSVRACFCRGTCCLWCCSMFVLWFRMPLKGITLNQEQCQEP